jgi:non-homologous end joining protein Ku
MADRPTWTGAVIFAGFPIYLRAFPLVQSRAGGSFKSLCPCHHLPIKQHKVCSNTGEVVDNGDLLKGVETAKDQFAVLDPDAVEFIRSSEGSDTVEVERFAPRGSLPLTYALGRYRLVPNEKMPGSEGPVGIFWNGLMATERAAVVPGFVPRSGSRDQLAVIVADVYGLDLLTLPFQSELRAPPEWAPETNEQAGAMFEQFTEQAGYTMDDFSWPAYESGYEARRSEAIEKALKGEIVTVDAGATPKPAVPDLMAAMQAALASTPAKKPAAKKPRAKAKAA